MTFLHFQILYILIFLAIKLAVFFGLVRLFNRPRIIEKNLIEETPKVFAARGADFLESAGSNFQETSSIFLTQPNPAWIWFLVGTLTVILIFAIINWRKL